MTALRPKRPRFRLDPESYRRLRQEVLERDRWRCQYCGATAELEVHHINFRSHLGHDEEQNLITLCWSCHRKIHESNRRSPKEQNDKGAKDR
jgi:5-methylcytosine-specific restriction endonuclease McrA